MTDLTHDGTAYGRYRLERRIGVGTLAEVFQAKSFGVEGFEKTLVVKRLLPELARDASFVEAFVHEAKLAVRLSHANVVQVFDLGRVDGDAGSSYFMAMEHVAGLDLAQALQLWRSRGEPPPLGFALYVASEVSKALDHAHRRRDEHAQPLGIVHGDVRARNVLLSWDGEVKLSDFCVARALRGAARQWLETEPRLADRAVSTSPEAVRGEPLTAASDAFALGSLTYELLTGVHPFRAPTPSQTLQNVAQVRWRPLAELRSGLPAELVDLVTRSLAPSAAARPESSARLYEELVAVMYASGSRYGAGELAELLEASREAPVLGVVESLFETTRSDGARSAAPVPAAAPSAVPPSLPSAPPPLLGGLGELKGEREVSVLVARLSGRLGAELVERARQILTRYGGLVLPDAPGEIRAVFGLGAVDSLDTENAVRAGLVVLRGLSGAVDLGVGVDVGRVRVGEDGALVEDERADELTRSARRLSALARGKLAVAPRAARNLRGQFELTPVIGGGKSDKLPLVVGDLLQRSEPTQRFVGRKTELRRLGELLAKAGRRELQVVGLGGDHGIGKTRLLEEAKARIARGAFDIGCYIAQCWPGARATPYAAIEAMLRTLCAVREGDPLEAVAAVEPRLRALGLVEEETRALLSLLGSAPAEPASGPGLLAAAFAHMLASLAEDRVHVLAWDNAHEIDDASLATLKSVIERLPSARLLLILSGRPREDGSDPALPGYHEIRVGELEEGDARRLVASRLGVDAVPDAVLAFVRERAGGHPMFIEELLREARDSGSLLVTAGSVERFAPSGALAVPRPLRTLLADRARRLPERERSALVAAAILGSPVDTAVLAAVLDLSVGTATALAQTLVARGLVEFEDPVTLRFCSPMLGEVVQSELLPEARAELHRSAANAYQIVLGPRTESEAFRIARHFAEAGDRARAAGFYATSGAYHLENRSFERAVADTARALDLSDLRSDPLSDLTEWVSNLCRAIRQARSGAGVFELLQRATAELLTRDDLAPLGRAMLTVDLVSMLGSLNRYREAQRLLSRALADAATPAELTPALLMAEAELQSRQGEFRSALAALERAGSFSAADVAVSHRRLVAMAQALGGAGEHARALAALDEAAGLADPDDVVAALERIKVRALIHGFSGDWRGCATECEQAAERAMALGLSHEAAIDLHNQGDALMRIGEHPRAYAVLTASSALAARIGAERTVNLNGMMLAYLDGLTGSPDAPRQLGQRLAQAEAQKWTWDALTGRTLLGKLLAQRGDLVAARRELSLTERLARSSGNRLVLDDCERALAELATRASAKP